MWIFSEDASRIFNSNLVRDFRISTVRNKIKLLAYFSTNWDDWCLVKTFETIEDSEKYLAKLLGELNNEEN